MKKLFLVVITLGLTAYLALPMPGQSRSLQDKIERKERAGPEEAQARGRPRPRTSPRTARASAACRATSADTRPARQKLQGSLQRKRAEVQRVQDRLEVAQDRLVRLRARLKEATDVLATRLVEIYKDDEPDVLTVILESDGFGDMLDRTAFLDRISDQDRAIVTRVRELKRETKKLTDQLAELEEQKQAAGRRDPGPEERGRAGARPAWSSARATWPPARGERRTLLATAREHRAHLEGDLRALEREQAAVRARIRAAQSARRARPAAAVAAAPTARSSAARAG